MSVVKHPVDVQKPELNSEKIKSPYDWSEYNVKQDFDSEKSSLNIEFDLQNPSVSNDTWRYNSEEDSWIRIEARKKQMDFLNDFENKNSI